MRSIAVRGSVVAVAVLGTTLFAACGPDGQAQVGNGPIVDGLLLEDGLAAPEDDVENDSEADCDAIMQTLQQDAMAMQSTDEYQALAETSQYKRVERDFIQMQLKGCKLSGGNQSTECKKLKTQAIRHQQAMVKTPQFKALAKTTEFKRVMKDARIAQENDCLDDVMVTSPALLF